MSLITPAKEYPANTALSAFKYIDAASLAAGVTGEPIASSELSQLSFHFSWDGTPGSPQGAFVFEVSDDPLCATDPSNAKWVDATAAVSTVLGTADPDGTASDGEQARVLRDLLAFTRVRYTRTGGSGTLTVFADGRRR